MRAPVESCRAAEDVRWFPPTTDATSRTGRIILQPNRSWTWQANLVFLAGLALISLTIALIFLLGGYWMILPFTLLELAAVTAAFYWCVRATHRQEVLTFSEDELLIERGIRAPEQRHVFKRLFARIFVRRPRPIPGTKPASPCAATAARWRSVTSSIPTTRRRLVTEPRRMAGAALAEEAPAR
ncbi:MAG: DUF2244 domain-containing protein [Gammaproteobacteria bacterium]|nr:DUF2244 domain-containing protein [Gammaproteobacteria bacterium]